MCGVLFKKLFPFFLSGSISCEFYFWGGVDLHRGNSRCFFKNLICNFFSELECLLLSLYLCELKLMGRLLNRMLSCFFLKVKAYLRVFQKIVQTLSCSMSFFSGRPGYDPISSWNLWHLPFSLFPKLCISFV